MLSNVTKFCQTYRGVKCLKIVSNYIQRPHSDKMIALKYRSLRNENEWLALLTIIFNYKQQR